MGGPCGMHGREKMYAVFLWVNLKERYHYGDQGIGGVINFIIDLKEVRLKGVSLTYLAWDRDWWKGFMNTERKLWVLCYVRNFSITVLEQSLFRGHREHKQNPVQYE